jgi:phosphoglycerate kinase
MNNLTNFNFKEKKALIRVDFNVPLDDSFKVTDTTRILSAKPTINHILKEGGSAILMSHLGRPKGKDNTFSLRHIVDEVSAILGVPVKFVSDCIGSSVKEAVDSLKLGEVLLLENLRFYPEEKAGDEAFAKQLSQWGDIYVNDAFGTAHRAHASTTIIAQFFDKQKCFGLLLEKELINIRKVLSDGKKPVTAILGGAKISSKIGVIENIIDKVDHVIIGGGMSFTFIKAQGGDIGDSLCEDDKMDLAIEILDKAKSKGVRIHLPLDVVIADEFKKDAKTDIVKIDEIPDGWMGLDIGPKTEIAYSFVVMQSQTILWNGPMGVFEMPRFSNGTQELGHAIADATLEGAFSLVGGGDSIAAVKQFGFADKVSYVSTGGGAMLELLEGKDLPGVVAIEK